MKTERKIIVLARHGDTSINKDGSRQDAITSESVLRLYDKSKEILGEFVLDYGVISSYSFLRHSGKKRTLYTGKALIAGAFFLKNPRSQKDLDKIKFGDVDIKEDKRLSYDSIQHNEEALDRGMEIYFSKWFRKPDATEYEGVPITPYNQVISTDGDCLNDMVNLLWHRKLGILVSHASIVDALAIAAVNSAYSGKKVGSFDEIGGQFAREEFAQLVIDRRKRSCSYEARLERKGRNYKVDLGNILS